MKFKNKHPGVEIIVENKFVLEQVKKSTDYEEVKEIKKPVEKTEKKK
jgi:hypothetical protein